MRACKYTVEHGHRCTAEAVDPDGELLLCYRHLAAAVELIRSLTDRVPAFAALTQETR